MQTLTTTLIDDIRVDILLGGDTQLICDDGLRFIVIEKNITKDFPLDCYFGFKFIYNKERVHVFQFDTEKDMLTFYEDNLKRGFIRRENVDDIERGIDNRENVDDIERGIDNQGSFYYPKWVEHQIKKNRYQKCQIEYRSRLFEKIS